MKLKEIQKDVINEYALLFGKEAAAEQLKHRIEEIKQQGADYLSRYIAWKHLNEDHMQRILLPIHNEENMICGCYECTDNRFLAGLEKLKTDIGQIEQRIQHLIQ